LPVMGALILTKASSRIIHIEKICVIAASCISSCSQGQTWWQLSHHRSHRAKKG
jgi:hypothetical protein